MTVNMPVLGTTISVLAWYQHNIHVKITELEIIWFQ